MGGGRKRGGEENGLDVLIGPASFRGGHPTRKIWQFPGFVKGEAQKKKKRKRGKSMTR